MALCLDHIESDLQNLFSAAHANLAGQTPLTAELMQARGFLQRAADQGDAAVVVTLLALARKLTDSVSNSSVKASTTVPSKNVVQLLGTLRNAIGDLAYQENNGPQRLRAVDDEIAAHIQKMISTARADELTLADEIRIAREFLAKADGKAWNSLANEVRQLSDTEMQLKTRAHERFPKSMMLDIGYQYLLYAALEFTDIDFTHAAESFIKLVLESCETN